MEHSIINILIKDDASNEYQVKLPSDLHNQLLNTKDFKFFGVDSKGFPFARIGNRSTRLVKYIEKRPKYHVTEYVDRNPLNLDPSNLKYRDLKLKRTENTKDTLKGAYYYPKKLSKKWLSLIFVDGKSRYLGYYYTEQEAHLAYLQAAKDLGAIL